MLVVKKLSKIFIGAFVACLFAVESAVAVPLQIVATPQESSGPFVHNLFHVNNDGGPSGLVTAWADLDASSTSFYDPDTGAIQVVLNLYSDSTLTTQTGSVTGIGSLPASNLTGTNTGATAGGITFTFSDGTPSTTISYSDNTFGTSTAGFTPNSWDGTYLTLWGAGLFGNAATGAIAAASSFSYLGSDLVFQTGDPIPGTVPEPSTLILLGAGVLGMALRGKRQA